MLIDLAEEYYPYLCTCIEDIDYLGEMMGSDAATQANFAKCGETDYDQCWFAVEQSDGTYACDNCDDYWLASDNSECFSCATAVETDDGSGNITYSCSTSCEGSWQLNTDVCEKDCTTMDTSGGAGNYVCWPSCVTAGYTVNAGETACEIAA